jgi:prophage antirepressor-like protein
MSNLQTLNHMEILGMSITTFGTRGKPLFLVDDVAEWLDYEDVSAMLQNVDEDEKVIKILPPDQCLAGLQPNTEYQFLTEHGFYEVLMRSQTPQAKRFKKGVKLVLHDVRIGSGIMDAVGNELGIPRLLHRYFATGQPR